MHLKTLILLVQVLFIGTNYALPPSNVKTREVETPYGLQQVIIINPRTNPGDKSTAILAEDARAICSEVVAAVNEQLKNATDLLSLSEKQCKEKLSTKSCKTEVQEANQKCEKGWSSKCDERVKKVTKDIEISASAKIAQSEKFCKDEKDKNLGEQRKCEKRVQEVNEQCAAKGKECCANCDKRVKAESDKTKKLEEQRKLDFTACENQKKDINTKLTAECNSRVKQAKDNCVTVEKDYKKRCDTRVEQAEREMRRKVTTELSRTCENEMKKNTELMLKNCDNRVQQETQKCLSSKVNRGPVNQYIAKRLQSLMPGSKYYISTEKLSWHLAGKVCKSNNMELVSIESEAENAALSRAITNERYWSSGTDFESEGNFYWAGTGKNIAGFKSYNAAHEPNNLNGNEHCLELFNRLSILRWNDFDCNKPLYFICELTV